MGKFCTKHVKDRTVEELEWRLKILNSRLPLGPGQKKEKARIEGELENRK